MIDTRLHVQDSLYALLVTYLKLASRDILNNFSVAWTPAQRSVTIDGVLFPIVLKLLGEPHEIPGVNLMFSDEYAHPMKTSPQTYYQLASVHLYKQATTNLSADNVTLLKLQTAIDSALYGSGVSIIDFYAVPPVRVGTKSVYWDMMGDREGWQELTDLEINTYLHRAKGLRLSFVA